MGLYHLCGYEISKMLCMKVYFGVTLTLIDEASQNTEPCALIPLVMKA